jgi:hypothetical protein
VLEIISENERCKEMSKVSLVYHHGRAGGLLIVALFAFSGVIISFILPGIIYPGESHAHYLSHVELFLPLIELLFFLAGLTISFRIRKKEIPGIIVGSRYTSPNVRTEIRIPEDSYQKAQNIDPIKNLEEKLDYYRNSAEVDSKVLPELAKRLLTLSIMYRNNDIEKSRLYREEAMKILNREDYPQNPEGEEVRKFAKNL